MKDLIVWMGIKRMLMTQVYVGPDWSEYGVPSGTQERV